jgi:hypothetical protein
LPAWLFNVVASRDPSNLPTDDFLSDDILRFFWEFMSSAQREAQAESVSAIVRQRDMFKALLDRLVAAPPGAPRPATVVVAPPARATRRTTWAPWSATNSAPRASSMDRCEGSANVALAPATQLCVGFNTWPALLPSLYGRGLSFTCSHAYADSGVIASWA